MNTGTKKLYCTLGMYKVQVLFDVQSGLEAIFSDDDTHHREVSSTVQ